MITMLSQHPSPDDVRAFGQGQLSAEAADAIERHVADCESCCRLLEEAPGGSFEGQVREASRGAPQATTADVVGGTLADVEGVPAELADHPRYRVLGLVGQGGMGAVYRAEHRRMERPVALKVINPALTRNPATVQRFQQEARTAARLHHPNIVTAYDADQAGGLHFLVMEYVEGRSLADLVNERGPLPIAEACEYARQVALGLQHAHERGMVHRDIKPHNLMVTTLASGVASAPREPTRGADATPLSGTLKILDFGLARFARTPDESLPGGADTSAALTGVGTVMGTADYIAPEQASDPRMADIRADIYSLGCTLFHLLTDRPPFPGSDVQDKLAKHASAALPSLTELRSDASPGLAAVVARMTAKDPAERYATPAEVAAALAPFAQSGGSHPRPAVRKRRRLLAAALVLLAAGIVVLRLQTDRGEIVIQTDDPSLEIVTRKGGEIVRIRDPKSGQTLELDTKNLRIRDLEHPDGLALEVPWRNGKVTFKSTGGKVVVMAGPAEIPDPPAFRPLFNGKDFDGWKLDPRKWAIKDNAIVADCGGEMLSERTVAKEFHLRMELKLKRGTGVVRFRVPTLGETDWNLALMDNRLGFVDGEIHTGRGLGQASTGLIKGIAKIDEWMVLEIIAQDQEAAVRINGKQVMYLHSEKYTPAPGRIALWIHEATERGETEMHVRKIEIKELPSTDSIRPGRVTDPVELAKLPNAADGLKQTDIPKDALAYIGGGDPENVPPEVVAVLGDTRFRCPEPSGPMAFSPDGKQIVVTNGRKEIRFLEVSTGRLLRQITSPYTPRYGMAFSPDGRRLAGTSVGDRFCVIDAETGRLVWELTEFKVHPVEELAFSPDGKLIYLSGKSSSGVETRGADDGAVKAFWHTQERGAGRFAYSPDGTILVTCGRKGAAVYNVVTKKDRDLGVNVIKAAFSPDGKHFAVARVSEPNQLFVTLYDPTGEYLHTMDAPADDILAFTPDGKTLVAVGTKSDGKVSRSVISRWNLADGKKLSLVTLPSLVPAIQLVLSPDGKTLARQSKDLRLIELFDVETGKPRYDSDGPWGSITALAFSHDGKLLASSDRYRTKLWDLSTARVTATWGETSFYRLAFSPDGKLLAGARPDRALSGDKTDTIRVHRVADGKLLHVIPTKTDSINSIAFSPDGSLLAGVGGGDSVRLWRVDDGKEIRILSYPRTVFSLLFSPDGSKLLAAGYAGIKVWETQTGLELKHLLPDGSFYLLEWLPDGKTLAARTGGSLLYVDPESGKVVQKRTIWGGLPGNQPNRPSFPSNSLSPGARFLCESESLGFTLTQLDPAPERQRTYRLSPSREFSSTEWRSSAFSPDGRYLACGNPEGVIILLRLSEQGKVPELPVR